MILISFFYSIVRLISKLRHTFFIYIQLLEKLNLQPSALLYAILCSAAENCGQIVVCDNAYVPPWSYGKSYGEKLKKRREEVKIAYFLYRNVVFKLRNNQDLSRNQLHNILRLFDVLPNFPFTTSEKMRDYYL